MSTAGRIVTALESQAQGLAQRQQQDAPRRAQAHQPPPPPSAFPPLAEGPGEGGENPPDSWRTDAMGTTGLGSTVGRPGSTGAEGAGPGLSYAARGGMSFAGVAAKPGAPRGGGGRDGGAGRGGRGGRGSRGGGASAWEGRPARAIDWVETGTAVATEYAATRAEAIELARQRARLFDEAQLAYKAGNGSAAKVRRRSGRGLGIGGRAAVGCAA